MESLKGKILIIGNELNLGEPIKTALSAAGYETFYVTHPDEAAAIIHSNRIDALVVDCMLPRISGVDFVEQFKKNFPTIKVEVILMSGIYTDKAFIMEAVKRTGATAFIKKQTPFDTTSVVEVVNKMTFFDGATGVKRDHTGRRSLYEMFGRDKVTTREKRKVIESLEEVNGFDLPFIYSLLIETKSSGYLNIYEKSGAISGIAISNGTIIAVDTEDKTTFLGEMLIQSGYALPRDVQEALADHTNLKIGQKLIKGNRLSPHAFDLILTEQMNIRLSRTISDKDIKVNFALTEVEPASPCIDGEQLLPYLHDWIVSKVSTDWLKTLYRMWSGHTIEKTPAFRVDHPVLEMSVFKQMGEMIKRIQTGTTINKILALPGINEGAVYKALHFLLTKGLIVFSTRNVFSSPQEQLSSIQKLIKDFEGKTPFEVLHMLNISADDPEEAVKDFTRILGPEPTAQGELHKSWHDAKKLFEETLRKSQDTSVMDQLRMANESKQAALKLKANHLIEEVKNLLQTNSFPKAFEKVTEAIKLYPAVGMGNVYLAWAKLGQMDSQRKPFSLKDIEYDLLQVPAEDRYDAQYLYVQGLCFKYKGEFNQAQKAFEKSVALDTSFILPRRELNTLATLSNKKQQDILNMDLKDVVAGFFKKKA